MSEEPGSGLASRKNSEDSVTRMIKGIGIALMIAFILPIFIGKEIVFLNIQGLFERSVPGVLKIEFLYPLLAGLGALKIAGMKRSREKAAALIFLGIFPFLFLLFDKSVREAFSGIAGGLPGGGSLGPNLILSALAIFGILAGAQASRIRAKLDLGAYVAAAGAGLYVVVLIIPIKGQFPFLQPFKLLGQTDPTGAGVMVLSGLVSLAAMALMVMAVIKCFQLLQAGAERERLGNAIIKLWVAQFFVYGAFLIYVLIVGASKSGGDAGMVLLSFLTTVPKLFLWIFGLYLLIPLGLSELILLAPGSGQIPAPASMESPTTTEGPAGPAA
jgi:hypothetical protein